MKILIIDADCSKAYSYETIHTQPMGGTEATVIRVAEALSGRHKVYVAQGAREQAISNPRGVSYIPWNKEEVRCKVSAPDRVIVVGAAKLLPRIRKRYPSAAMFLWVHNFPGKRKRKTINQYALRSNTTLVAVSDTLRQQLIQYLTTYRNGFGKAPGNLVAHVQVVYNPIDNNLQPNDTPVDRDKLVYISSPHKGLEQVLNAFKALRAARPQCKLFIANPGYLPLQLAQVPEGVEVLGSLSHHEVLQHVREAFCVFYPQNQFPETFGLVFAEANAVGTPVLTHPIGAATEVLENTRQLVNASNIFEVIDRMLEWYQEGRPVVSGKEQFRTSAVLNRWESILAVPDCLPRRANTWFNVKSNSYQAGVNY